ncbi:MAG: hypothetical protein QOI44_2029, partial [Actinomycetota bacterium]|nr:hypothetical protein [Actinomycetota bacterium]
VAVRVLEVDARRETLGAEQPVGALRSGKPLGEGIEIGRLDDESEVVEISLGAGGWSPTVGRHTEEVDDRRGVDPDRREEHLTAAPLVGALGLESQLVAVERERRLYVGDAQHDVVEPRHPHCRHGFGG